MLGNTHVMPGTFLDRLGPLVTCLLEVRAFFLDIIIDACKGQGLYHTQVENLLVTLFRVPLIQSFVLCARCICLFVYLFCLAVNFYKNKYLKVSIIIYLLKYDNL